MSTQREQLEAMYGKEYADKVLGPEEGKSSLSDWVNQRLGTGPKPVYDENGNYIGMEDPNNPGRYLAPIGGPEDQARSGIGYQPTPPVTPPGSRWMPDPFTPEAKLPGAGDYNYGPIVSETDALYSAPATGMYSPFETPAMQGESRASKAMADQRGVDAQYQAIQDTRNAYGELGAAGAKVGDIYNDFRDIYNQGGMTAIDRARMEEAKAQNLMLARQQRESALANMEARGMGGSGAELAAVLSGQEGVNRNMSAESLGMNAAAMERATQALYGAQGAAQTQGTIGNMRGALAGQLGSIGYNRAGQQFQEEFDTGTAADLVNKFNTEGMRAAETARAKTMRDAITTDTTRRNENERGNVDWGRGMYVSDVDARNAAGVMNTQAANAQNSYWNVEEPWRVNAAQMDKAKTLAGINTTVYTAEKQAQAQKEAAEAAATAGMWGSIFGGAGSVIGAGINKWG